VGAGELSNLFQFVFFLTPAVFYRGNGTTATIGPDGHIARTSLAPSWLSFPRCYHEFSYPENVGRATGRTSAARPILFFLPGRPHFPIFIEINVHRPPPSCLSGCHGPCLFSFPVQQAVTQSNWGHSLIVLSLALYVPVPVASAFRRNRRRTFKGLRPSLFHFLSVLFWTGFMDLPRERAWGD